MSFDNTDNLEFTEEKNNPVFDNDEFEKETEELFHNENVPTVINNPDDTILDNDYDEVLKLTEYAGDLANTNSNFGVVAEYKDIDIVQIDNKHKASATKFINKVTKFILDFKDQELTEEHKAYVKEVAKLQLDHLQDMLSLVEINKQMLNNIVRRVNAVQAEDYAMINTYNTLSNQHLKLLKETQNLYKSIPSTIKKMRTEVICDQELIEEVDTDVITEGFGETQFNNQKQLLKNLREQKELKDKNN